MNWKIGAIAIAALLLLPMAFAAPNVQTGTQSGALWSARSPVAVQPGTEFVLTGIVGDHDIFFFTATGGFAGASVQCGSDISPLYPFGAGVPNVPANAASGQVWLWLSVGFWPTCFGQNGFLPSSTWVYVDGL